MRLSLSGLGILNYQNNKVSGEQYFLKKVLPRILRSDRVIFLDVGANIGSYTLELTRLFPNAKVHSFEPHPKNFEQLKSAITSENVVLHNVAMGAATGKAVLYDRADCDGSEHATLHEAVLTDIHHIGIVATEINVDTLDNLASIHKIDFIDLLKIDTEGHELAVLQGAAKLLKQQKVGCIHFEFNEMNVVSRVFLNDFRKILPGYSLFRLLPKGLLPLSHSPLETELFAYQNIIALPQSS